MIGIHVNWELKFLIENRVKADEKDMNNRERTTKLLIKTSVECRAMQLPVKLLFIGHQSYQSTMSEKKITVKSIIPDDRVNRFFSTSFSLNTSFSRTRSKRQIYDSKTDGYISI